MKKRIANIVLSVCLCFTLLPTAAFAEETSDPATPTTTTNKTLMLGTGGIKSPTQVDAGKDDDENQQYHYTPNSYIYFGMNGETPIKWRVLNADKANDGTTSGMFLLSEYLLGSDMYFQKTYHKDNDNKKHRGAEPTNEDHTNCVNANVYQGSDAQKWCFDFAANPDNFSTAEQGVMLGVEKTDDEKTLYEISWGTANLTTNDKLFFISAEELANYVGNYNYAPTLKNDEQSVCDWWLRSPKVTSSFGNAGNINPSDDEHPYGEGDVFGSDVKKPGSTARPAFNLNLNSVLFISPAENSKNGTFSAISDYTGSEWKLTLKDESRSGFSAEIFITTTRTIVSYKGATTGTNEHITAMVVNGNNEVTYYGSLKNITEAADASGIIEIDLSGKMDNGEKVYILNEQWNGDYKTDYASAFKAVTPTEDNTPPTLTAGTASRTSGTNAAVTFTSNEAGTYYYAVVDSGATAPSIDTTGAGTACIKGENTISLTNLTAGAKDIYIVAKDAAGNMMNDPLTITIPAYVPPSSGSSDPTYSVTAPKADNGTVKVSPRYAEQGDTVTITVTPDEGYLLDSLTVTDKNGNALELKDLGNGKYSFKMPKGKVNVEAAFVEDTEPLPSFADVPANAYYYDAVLWAAKNGVTGGVDENHFAPNEPCSRAQLVTFLWRAAGQPEASGTSGMTDVSQNAYYADAVAWAFENGIVGGYGNGLFGSDDTITREQMAVILYRFAQATGMDTTQGGMSVREYQDFDNVSDYAVAAIQWAVNAGVMQGNDGNLMPGQPCTRAQIVTMLYRLLGE